MATIQTVLCPINLAEESPPSLIVMATHGRSGLGRLLMGSVAEQVLRRAPCPVVTMLTPREETHAAEVASRELAETARE
jgi:hypothetical protein